MQPKWGKNKNKNRIEKSLAILKPAFPPIELSDQVYDTYQLGRKAGFLNTN